MMMKLGKRLNQIAKLIEKNNVVATLAATMAKLCCMCYSIP